MTNRQMLLGRCYWHYGLLLLLLTLLQLEAQPAGPQGHAGPAVCSEEGPLIEAARKQQHAEVLEDLEGQVPVLDVSLTTGERPTLRNPLDQLGDAASPLLQGGSQTQTDAPASVSFISADSGASTKQHLQHLQAAACGRLLLQNTKASIDSSSTTATPAVTSTNGAPAYAASIPSSATTDAAAEPASKALDENASLPLQVPRLSILPLPPPDEFDWDSYADAGQADGFELASMADPGATAAPNSAIPLPHVEVAPTAQGQATDFAQESSLPQDAATERRMNLASAADGASVVAANKEARKPEKTIDGDGDSYMKNLCSATKWLVLELSQLGRVDEVQLLNKEMYSSRVRDFSVKGRQSHPRKDGPLAELPRWFDTEHWQLLGNFTAANKKGDQTFKMQTPRRVRYLLFQFHTHYGSEEVCALNSISVLGVSAAQELEDALSRHLTGSETAAASSHPAVHTLTKDAGAAAVANQPSGQNTAPVLHQQQKADITKTVVGVPPTTERSTPAPSLDHSAVLGPDGELLPVLDLPVRLPGSGSSNVQPAVKGECVAPAISHAGGAATDNAAPGQCLPGVGGVARPGLGSHAQVRADSMVGGPLHSADTAQVSATPASADVVSSSKNAAGCSAQVQVAGSQQVQADAASMSGKQEVIGIVTKGGASTPAACNSTSQTSTAAVETQDDKCASVAGTQAGISAGTGKPSAACDKSVQEHSEMADGAAAKSSADSKTPQTGQQATPKQASIIVTSAASTSDVKAGDVCGSAAAGMYSSKETLEGATAAHGTGQHDGKAPVVIASGGGAIDSKQMAGSTSQEQSSAASGHKDSSKSATAPEQSNVQVNVPPSGTQQQGVALSSDQQQERMAEPVAAPTAPPGKPVPLKPSVPVAPGTVSGQPGNEVGSMAAASDSGTAANSRSAGAESREQVSDGGRGLLRFPSPDPMPTSVVDSLIAALEGGPAAKPKQAGNLFDLFKQEFVLLRVNQSRTWKYIHNLVEVLSHNTGHAAQQQVELEGQLAAVREQLAALPAQVEAAVLMRVDHMYAQQLTAMANQLADMKQQMHAGRHREWAWTLYCSCLLSLLAGILIGRLTSQTSVPQTSAHMEASTINKLNGHDSSNGMRTVHSNRAGRFARLMLRFVLLVGVLNGIIGMLLHSPDLQRSLLLLIRRHSSIPMLSD